MGATANSIYTGGCTMGTQSYKRKQQSFKTRSCIYQASAALQKRKSLHREKDCIEKKLA